MPLRISEQGVVAESLDLIQRMELPQPVNQSLPGWRDHLPTDSERLVAAWLDGLELEYSYEQSFFPLSVDYPVAGCRSYSGLRPDFCVLPTSQRPEQFIEVTEAKKSCRTSKRQKIRRVVERYGIRVHLVGVVWTKPGEAEVEVVTFSRQGTDLVELTETRRLDGPEQLLETLVTYDELLPLVAEPPAA